MQVHKAICAPSLGGIRVSRCLVCKQHRQRRPGRAAVLVIFRAKLPQSTSSWTPFGWELDKKFDSKYATVGEHTVHYLKAGQGKTVILMIASQVVLARSYRSTVNAMSREHTVVCLELPGEKAFCDIYSYAYGFACEKGQKCLQLDTAVAIWQLRSQNKAGLWSRDSVIFWRQITSLLSIRR